MEEIWKDIPGYKGYYQASNLGRIKSLHRTIIRSNGWKQTFRERILIPVKQKNGYLAVQLRKVNYGGSYYIHKLVIESFKDNVFKKSDINHIDSNKLNNNIINLEYATRSENMKHAYLYGGVVSKNKGKIGEKSKLSKKVQKISPKGEILSEYFGTNEASRMTGICQSCIVMTCNKLQKQAGGYIWKYV